MAGMPKYRSNCHPKFSVGTIKSESEADVSVRVPYPPGPSTCDIASDAARALDLLPRTHSGVANVGLHSAFEVYRSFDPWVQHKDALTGVSTGKGICCAPSGIRTPDPLIKSQLL